MKIKTEKIFFEGYNFLNSDNKSIMNQLLISIMNVCYSGLTSTKYTLKQCCTIESLVFLFFFNSLFSSLGGANNTHSLTC